MSSYRYEPHGLYVHTGSLIFQHAALLPQQHQVLIINTETVSLF